LLVILGLSLLFVMFLLFVVQDSAEANVSQIGGMGRGLMMMIIILVGIQFMLVPGALVWKVQNGSDPLDVGQTSAIISASWYFSLMILGIVIVVTLLGKLNTSADTINRARLKAMRPKIEKFWKTLNGHREYFGCADPAVVEFVADTEQLKRAVDIGKHLRTDIESIFEMNDDDLQDMCEALVPIQVDVTVEVVPEPLDNEDTATKEKRLRDSAEIRRLASVRRRKAEKRIPGKCPEKAFAASVSKPDLCGVLINVNLILNKKVALARTAGGLSGIDTKTFPAIMLLGTAYVSTIGGIISGSFDFRADKDTVNALSFGLGGAAAMILSAFVLLFMLKIDGANAEKCEVPATGPK
jgi:hypothetical protein